MTLFRSTFGLKIYYRCLWFLCYAMICEYTNLKILEQLIIWFSYFEHKKHFRPHWDWKAPKIDCAILYIYMTSQRAFEYGAIYIFLLWLNPCNTLKASMMHWWHTCTELFNVINMFFLVFIIWLWNCENRQDEVPDFIELKLNGQFELCFAKFRLAY